MTADPAGSKTRALTITLPNTAVGGTCKLSVVIVGTCGRASIGRMNGDEQEENGY